MVLHPFHERADVLGVLQERLWTKNEFLRDTKLQSNDTRFATANSNNLTAITLNVYDPIKCTSGNCEPSSQNTSENLMCDGIE